MARCTRPSSGLAARVAARWRRWCHRHGRGRVPRTRSRLTAVRPPAADSVRPRSQCQARPANAGRSRPSRCGVAGGARCPAGTAAACRAIMPGGSRDLRLERRRPADRGAAGRRRLERHLAAVVADRDVPADERVRQAARRLERDDLLDRAGAARRAARAPRRRLRRSGSRAACRRASVPLAPVRPGRDVGEQRPDGLGRGARRVLGFDRRGGHRGAPRSACPVVCAPPP